MYDTVNWGSTVLYDHHVNPSSDWTKKIIRIILHLFCQIRRRIGLTVIENSRPPIYHLGRRDVKKLTSSKNSGCEEPTARVISRAHIVYRIYDMNIIYI